MVIFDEEKQKKKLEELYRKEEEDLAQILSQKYGLQYIDLTRVSIDMDSLRLIPEKEARGSGVAAFFKVAKKLSVAVLSPTADKTKRAIKKLEGDGYQVTVFMVSKQSLIHAWDRYKDLSFATETKAGVFQISEEEVEQLVNEVRTVKDVQKMVADVMKLKKLYRISKIFEIILAGGLATEASDIHIEPEERAVRMRYRLDGVLIDILDFDTETYLLLLSRVKLLSGLKINVKNEAQDGRFSVRVQKKEIEIRTSILPGAYGESIVLRILNPDTISVPMEELGMEKALLKILEHEIRRPNGMILNTGPTGSGKTTTLYAFLRKVHTPSIKIVTIEDPIEYHLEGIVQTQTSKKSYTFAKGLRSALRQDPDIIMVGEIRDEEVAETAINAALTGHLVFSTLHTNNAAGSFPRLIDLGVNPKVIASAVNVVMAQRLVRKLCKVCKKERTPTKDEQVLIESVLSSIQSQDQIPENRNTIWSAAGCNACGETGYKGRIGIFEAILMDEVIENLVKQSASEREIRDGARPQKILNMEQDGIIKVLHGITSLEDLGRVIDLSGKIAL